MRFLLCFIGFAAMLLASCDTRTADEKDVEHRFRHIDSLLADNSLHAARLELDSIHLLYPRMVDARRAAKALDDTITLRESLRTLAYCDSLLPGKLRQADSIQRAFRYERDETYERTGRYVYKTLRIEANADRCYLRAYVDEQADFYLISHFTGNHRLEHTRVKASTGDTYATTDSIATDNPSNHAFSDGDTRWEIVTYKNEAAGSLPAFLAQYADRRIKITLTGNRRNYVYYLSEADKKALSETYNLWVTKKDVLLLQREIEKAQAKIRRVIGG